MTRAIIIDDEQHCIDRLMMLLSPSHDHIIEIVGTAPSVEEGIEAITLLQPDLVFLDVQIHNKTGFDLLQALPTKNFQVIFTTAYEKFAIQAIKFSALDYLLKPVDKEELDIALLKLSSDQASSATAKKIDMLLQNTQSMNAPKRMMVPTMNGFEFLEIANIIRCQSDVNYTTIYSINKQKLLVAKTLKEFEELLGGHSFFRVHNSHLINLNFIKNYNKGKGGSVMLTDGTEVEVSSRRKDEFIKRLMEM